MVKKKSKYLRGKYLPDPFAVTWLWSYDPLSVRVGYSKDGYRWAFFYRGRKRVWDCNYDFFKYHFYKKEKMK